MERISEELCVECRNHMANDRNQNRATMLHFTVKSKHVICMEVLLKAGVDVNFADDSTFTPLMVAADEDYVLGVYRLIQAGADVNRTNKDNKTALILASSKGHDKCVGLLLNAAADVNVWTNDEYKHFTALHAAANSKEIKTGADANRSEENETGLSKTRFEGPDKCIKMLLDAGADVNALTSGLGKKFTALHYAVGSESISRIEVLLKEGADVNKEGYESSREYRGVTALSLAAGDGFDEAVKLLIEAGADVNKVPKNGTTPLIETIQLYQGGASKRTKCIKLLLQAGADVNVERLDHTPLNMLIKHGFYEALELLIRAGADVNLVNSNGNTALNAFSLGRLCYHREMNRFGCLKLLLRSGVKINIRNSRSENALQRLVGPTGTDIIPFLFDDFETQDSNTDADICRLLFAAGETLDGIPDEEIPDYLRFNDVKLNLKQMCRETIRKHLLHLDPHTHLFGRVPRLKLPSLLTEYLVYDMSLDDDVDDNSNGDGDIDNGNNENSI